MLSDNALHFQSGLHILGIGHTVGNNGGFQCNNRLSCCQGFCHFGLDVQILVKIHNAILLM